MKSPSDARPRTLARYDCTAKALETQATEQSECLKKLEWQIRAWSRNVLNITLMVNEKEIKFAFSNNSIPKLSSVDQP